MKKIDKSGLNYPRYMTQQSVLRILRCSHRGPLPPPTGGVLPPCIQNLTIVIMNKSFEFQNDCLKIICIRYNCTQFCPTPLC